MRGVCVQCGLDEEEMVHDSPVAELGHPYFPRLRVLDLFSGLNGWSSAWKARGHETFTIDNDPVFGADLVKDMFDVEPGDVPWKPDVILASPPCTSFTVMQIGRNWNHDNTPKTASAAKGLELVKRALWLIEELEPRFWVMENPRGKLRKLSPMTMYSRRTVTYCKYGEKRMKPTDLWSTAQNWGTLWALRLIPPCRNGDPCHTSAPRGSRTATQGMESAVAAKIPEQLSLAFCTAAEVSLR